MQAVLGSKNSGRQKSARVYKPVFFLLILFIGAAPCGYTQSAADADALMQEGSNLYYQGRYAEALTVFEHAKDIDEGLGDSRLMNLGFDYGWIGECRKMLGDFTEAEKDYIRARDLLMEAGQEVYASLYTGNIGWLYKERGEYDRAYELFNEAYLVGEESGEPYYISIWISHLAEIHEYRGEWEEAVEKNRRAYEVAESAGMETQQYIVANNLANQLWHLGSGAEAEGFYETALDIAEYNGWDEEVHNQRKNLISLNDDLRDFQDSLDYGQEGYERARWKKDRQQEYLTLMGDTAMRMEAYARAEGYFEHALRLARKLEDESLTAAALNNLGKTYSDWGRPEDALDLFQQALELSEELDAPDDMATHLNNLGSVYHHLGDYEKAAEYYEQALAIDIERGNRQDVGIAYNNLSSLYDAWGRYDVAVEYLDYALDIARELNYPEDEATYLNNLGLIYLAWGDYNTAVDICTQALRIAEKQGLKGSVGRYHSNIGLCLVEMERYREALEHFEISKTISVSLQNDWDLAVDYINIGAALSSLGDNESALASYSAALAIALDLGQREKLATCYNNIGKIHEEEGKKKEAVNNYTDALSIAEEMRRPDDMSVYLTNIGSVYYDLQNYRKAEQHFLRSIDILEELRLTAPGKIRRDYLASQIHNYRWLVLTYLKEGKPHLAFDIAELASAKYLAEQIGGSLDEADLDFPGIDVYMDTLPDETAVVNIVELNGPRYMILVATNTVVSGIEIELTDFLKEFSSEFGRDVGRQLSRIALRGLQRVEDEPGEEETGPALQLKEELDFNDLIRYYRYLLSKPVLRRSEREVFGRIARELYTAFLEPFTDELEDKSELIILPDGPMALVPFETFQRVDGRYLIEEYEIRYSQSLTVLELIAARDYSEERKSLLAFGGAVYSGESYEADMVQSEKHLQELKNEAADLVSRGGDARQVYSSVGVSGWTNLPGSLAEVRAIEETVAGSRVLTGRDVSEEEVKRLSREGELAGYRRIHFATHGIVMPEIPELSAVVLSLLDDPVKEDGYLNMKEISELRLESDFVNLSACETGLGKIYSGEGVVGLTQAFLVAGTKGISVSLWQVADESTMRFMTGFYRLIEEQGLRYHSAAAEMKRRFIQDPGLSAPFFWAPFVYYGE